jgi:hypothetical protein
MKSASKAVRLLVMAALGLVLPAVTARATNYYMDSVAGSESNDGKSPSTAWKTLTATSKANTTTFQPGDQLLFKRGCSWTGFLHLLGNGSSTARLVVDAYGTGADPIINAAGIKESANSNACYAIGMWNKQYVTIQNLELTNDAATSASRSGIHIAYSGTAGTTFSGVQILNNKIHNVRALTDSSLNAQSNAAIFIHIEDTCTNKVDSLLIEGNELYDLRTGGIFQKNPPTYAGNPQLWATNEIIRNNIIDKTGTDGIVINGAMAPLIEANAAYDCGINSDGFAYFGGMWSAIRCQDATFQFNEVARVHNMAPVTFLSDAQAFDADLGSLGVNLFQYNYTHDNEGGVLIMMSEAVAKTVIYRYNISVNDDRRTNSGTQMPIKAQAGTNAAYVYNNVFYSTLDLGYRFQDNEANYFYNNIFYTKGAIYPTKTTFLNNCYYGHAAEVTDAYQVTSDPKFVGPLPTTAGADGFAAADVFKLQSSSPCINAGRSITTPISNGGEDFWGNPLYAGTYADIGAHEVAGASNPPPAAPTLTDNVASSSVVYTGSWTHASDPLYYNSTKSTSSTVGNKVVYTFTGTNVSLFGRKGAAYGKISVSVDGGTATVLDCYWARELYRKEIFRATGLASGSHTLTVTVAAKNAYASANTVAVDYFQTLASSPAAWPQVTPYDIPTYGTANGTWTYTPTDGTKFYGGTRAASSTVGDTMSFTFTGTGIRLYGTKAPSQGKLSIKIDGGAATVVNCFQPGIGDEYRYDYLAKLYEINGLANGSHTIVATVATKDPDSSANTISLDLFEVLVGGGGGGGGGSLVDSADYQFGTSTATYASTDSDAGSTAGSMAFGAGITTGGISTTSGNPPNCLFVKAANNTTEANAISGNKYITCTVTPGSALSFKAIAFDYTRDAAASATNYSVRSSADNYAATIGAGTLTGLNSWTAASIDLGSVAALQNASAATTFRIYLWGGTDTTTVTRFDNIKVKTGP